MLIYLIQRTQTMKCSVQLRHGVGEKKKRRLHELRLIRNWQWPGCTTSSLMIFEAAQSRNSSQGGSSQSRPTSHKRIEMCEKKTQYRWSDGRGSVPHRLYCEYCENKMAVWNKWTVCEAAGPPLSSTLFFYSGHTIKYCPGFCCHGLLWLNSFTGFY